MRCWLKKKAPGKWVSKHVLWRKQILTPHRCWINCWSRFIVKKTGRTDIHYCVTENVSITEFNDLYILYILYIGIHTGLLEWEVITLKGLQKFTKIRRPWRGDWILVFNQQEKPSINVIRFLSPEGKDKESSVQVGNNSIGLEKFIFTFGQVLFHIVFLRSYHKSIII